MARSKSVKEISAQDLFKLLGLETEKKHKLKLSNHIIHGHFNARSCFISSDVDLSSVSINNDFDISSTNLNGIWKVNKVLFKQGFDLDHIIIAGLLHLKKCQIQRLFANNIRVETELLDLTDTKIIEAAEFSYAELTNLGICFQRADITCDLDLNHSKINGQLNLAKAKIAGNIDLSNSEIECTANFVNCTIAGDLILEGACIDKINLTNTNIKGDLLAQDVTIYEPINLTSLKVAGKIILTNADTQEIKIGKNTIQF